MNVKTLKNLLANDREHVLLIDVREPVEVSDEPYFEIPPENYLPISLTILSVMPGGELENKISETLARLKWEKNSVRIVTLCRSGMRSERACQYFSRLGFSFPVESLDGGHGAWMTKSGV